MGGRQVLQASPEPVDLSESSSPHVVVGLMLEEGENVESTVDADLFCA